ncbi:MAG: hypothetical protein ACPG4Z_00060 [Chitinophagales bacterium]
MKKHTILFVLLFLCLISYSQQTKHNDIIVDFVERVKYDSIEELARHVSYPLKRQYPIPEINNEQEFIDKYDILFDDSLSQIIINSDITEDWSEVGWRGIMLELGLLWIDDMGNLIAINYQTEIEVKERDSLILADKNSLHESIQNHVTPILVWETENYRIRIDEMEDGTYRYASWKKDAAIDAVPDLVIENGEHKFEGSGGNQTYKFRNGAFFYECYINKLGEAESPKGTLRVYRNRQEILTEYTIDKL